MKKVTVIKSNADLEELLTRMLARIAQLEEDYKLLDAEMDAMSNIISADGAFDN